MVLRIIPVIFFLSLVSVCYPGYLLFMSQKPRSRPPQSTKSVTSCSLLLSASWELWLSAPSPFESKLLWLCSWSLASNEKKDSLRGSSAPLPKLPKLWPCWYPNGVGELAGVVVLVLLWSLVWSFWELKASCWDTWEEFQKAQMFSYNRSSPSDKFGPANFY